MKKAAWGRCVLCASLLGLLGISGYAGARRQEVSRAVSVPITFETLEEAAWTHEERGESLEDKRQSALSMLEEVLAHPGAKESLVSRALEEKEEMALCMQKEANLEQALDKIGAHGTRAILSGGAVAVFAPAEIALDDKMRVQIVDMAVSMTGVSAEYVKIILAKNE